MIALLIIAGLAPFTFIKGKDGQPLMRFSDIKMPDSKLPELSLPDELSIDTQTNPEGMVYKWKDSHGTWQFSNEPPPEGILFTATVYDSNMNVIQAVETKRSVPKKDGIPQSSDKPVSSISDAGSVYEPKKIEELFDDANNLESLLNNRMNEQNKALNNL